MCTDSSFYVVEANFLNYQCKHSLNHFFFILEFDDSFQTRIRLFFRIMSFSSSFLLCTFLGNTVVQFIVDFMCHLFHCWHNMCIFVSYFLTVLLFSVDVVFFFFFFKIKVPGTVVNYWMFFNILVGLFYVYSQYAFQRFHFFSISLKRTDFRIDHTLHVIFDGRYILAYWLLRSLRL